MKDQQNPQKNIKFQSAVPHFLWGLLLLITLGAELSAKYVPGFATWYSVHIYRFLLFTWGRAVGLLPWSFAEMSICSLILGLLVYTLYLLGCVIKKERKWYLGVTSWFVFTARILIFCLAVFVFGCGINYYRTSFAESAGYEIRGCTEEELRTAMVYLVEQINENVDEISYNESGMSVPPKDFMKDCTLAIERFGANSGVTSTFVPKAKPLVFSRFFTIQTITGIYLPTIEANYNREQTGEELGYTVCHELSHLSGYMLEDEANMISYLACSESDSPYLRYSSAIVAFNYLANAYKGKDEAEIFGMIDDRAYEDMYQTWQFWEQYRKPVAKVGEKEIVVSEIHKEINDTYLKVTGDTNGVKSYDLVVELIVEHLRKEQIITDHNGS